MVEVQKLEVFPRELSRGSRACSGGSRVRFLHGPRAGVARCNLHFKATCAEQLAQSKLHRATCADQLAPTSLRRAPCLEQLAQSNLRRATYAEQLAQSNLHRAPCLVLSRACFTNASCREKERMLQRWADLACDVLLSGQPWSSSLLLFMHLFFLCLLLNCLYIHACIYALLRACMHTRIHAYMHPCIHASTHALIHTSRWTHVQSTDADRHTHSSVRPPIHTSIRTYRRTYVHTYLLKSIRNKTRVHSL